MKRFLLAAAGVLAFCVALSYGQTNVAQNKAVTTSSVQTGNVAANAVDGNTGTRWCAVDGTVPQWLMVDLGGNYAIIRSEVMWEKSAVYKYKVETSSDNATWTQRVDRTGNTGSQQTFTDNFTITARYVRITATGLPASTWTSIFEFRVFGTSAVVAPVITTQPANRTVTAGQTASFSIVATGTPTPTYQWRKNGTAISGATANSYTTPATVRADSGAQFSCVVTNAGGTVTSNNAILSVMVNYRQQDSLALVALYNSTGGANWTNKTNWLSSQPIDTWYGVTMTSGRVIQIHLSNNNLNGSIPSGIGNLTNLQELELSYNSLVGTFPVEMRNLAELINLNFSNNSLSDTLPSWLGNLLHLQYVYLGYNQLTGQIPSSLGNLTNLVYFFCESNQLSGYIPTELGNARNLWGLLLQQNQLSGSIPSTIGNLGNLTTIDLSRNRLSGTIPSHFGALTRLLSLALMGNSLTNLPDSITNLTGISSCDIGLNQFCNLSPSVISWANAHDTDWAQTQTCPAPTIQISATPLSGSAPLNVTFTATNTSSSSIDTWRWTFGDGTTAAIQNPAHTYNTSGSYTAQLIATGIGGSDTVSVAIQVVAPPTIITQPLSITVNQGATANFSVVASSTVSMTYQWYKSNSIITGATASTYSKSNVQLADTGSYTVRVTNIAGFVTSLPARLSVVLAPTIITQPVSQIINQNSPVTFSVNASGAAPLTYQWKKNAVNIPGATATSFSITSVQMPDSGNYSVTVTNAAGSVTSNNARLTVVAAPLPPVIITDPQSQMVTVSAPVSFSVVASGATPFTYQWQKNGTATGTNSATLSISSVASSDSGSYRVIVSNAAGRDTSAYAVLTVVPVSVRFTSQMLSVSGMLYDTTGTPIGSVSPDSIQATVRLYDSISSGSVKYTEVFRKADRHAIIVDKGFFVARLGQGTTTDTLTQVVSRSASLWVEITIESPTPDVLLPRVPLTAAPYSISSTPLFGLKATTLHGNGKPGDVGVEAETGTYYVDDASGLTWVKLNLGWKVAD